MSSTLVEPFHLASPGESGKDGLIRRLGASLVERLLGLSKLNACYQQVANDNSDRGFCAKALSAVGAGYSFTTQQASCIPKTGPLVVVANHPFGGLEGLVLIDLLLRIRPDVKVMANYLLGRIPELAEHTIYVDPFATESARRKNAAPMREAIDWVANGGCLGVFPAGEVAHYRAAERAVVDPPWNETIARIVKRSGATVVPLFFAGRNGLKFQLAGLVHPRLRTILLPRELLNKRRSSMRVCIGHPIGPSRLKRIQSPRELVDFLRLRTYILDDTRAALETKTVPSSTRFEQPIAAAGHPNRIAEEIATLPDSDCLVDHGEFQVFCSAAEDIPATLREIGRLREVTFRAVGEGTGRAIDLDRFDPHYRHLFAWDRENQQIVGAYRIGITDDILSRFGLDGLYTSTLFHLHPRLFGQVGSSLELGRSFVVPEYQKQHAPLLLLWMGIGRFVAANPKYKVLFGAVSISDDYSSTTKQLLIDFLTANRMADDLMPLIRPKRPPRLKAMQRGTRNLIASTVHNIDEVDELVGEIEQDCRTSPILVRQYLKLNARLLGFNTDPDFGDVIDGLMMADLTTIDRKLLVRYLGRDGAERFREYHTGATDA